LRMSWFEGVAPFIAPVPSLPEAKAAYEVAHLKLARRPKQLRPSAVPQRVV